MRSWFFGWSGHLLVSAVYLDIVKLQLVCWAWQHQPIHSCLGHLTSRQLSVRRYIKLFFFYFCVIIMKWTIIFNCETGPGANFRTWQKKTEKVKWETLNESDENIRHQKEYFNGFLDEYEADSTALFFVSWDPDGASSWPSGWQWWFWWWSISHGSP